jgi:ABC-type transport system involved in cytochrome bd biosynthesis fused ATPase/permease subunit
MKSLLVLLFSIILGVGFMASLIFLVQEPIHNHVKATHQISDLKTVSTVYCIDEGKVYSEGKHKDIKSTITIYPKIKINTHEFTK